MAQTQDNILFDRSLSSYSSAQADKPYVDKELLYISDMNTSTDYRSNELIFETTTLSNNGKFIDYSDGFISIPLCITLTRDAGHAVTAADAENIIRMKNSLLIVDSVQIKYNNTLVVQSSDQLSPLLVFREHSTFSQGDVALHSSTIGYAKDSSDSWTWEDSAVGIKNNESATNKACEKSQFVVEREAGVLSATAIKESGANTREVSADGLTHIFYYDCIIRLKDLHLDFFSKLGMVRGANLQIKLRLNQGDVSTTVVASDKIIMTPQLKGSLFPVMRVNDLVGASNARADYSETISVKVVKNGAYGCQKNGCRLYVSAMTLAPEAESTLLSKQTKMIRYCDVHSNSFTGVTGSFRHMLTNSISRVQRLIIVPVLDASSNGAADAAFAKSSPLHSPYASEGATCSPCHISNFQVKISGHNLYSNNIDYKYEHYLHEMNGAYGANSGKETGVVSGLISQRDYESSYSYIVVDLSRKLKQDEMTPVSIEIMGTLKSGRKLQFLTYIEYEKDLTIDLSTGSMIDQ